LKLCVGVKKKDGRFMNENSITATNNVRMVEGGRLMRVKPGGVALKSSAEVAEGVIQVSLGAKRCEIKQDQI